MKNNAPFLNLRTYYSRLTRRNQRNAELLLERVRLEHPELLAERQQLISRRQDLELARAKGVEANLVAEYANEIVKLENRYARHLVKLGLPSCFPAPDVSCKLCGDTGYVEEDGTVRECKCHLQLKRTNQLALCQNKLELPLFSQWRSDFYPEMEILQTKTDKKQAQTQTRNPRAINTRVKDVLEAWSNESLNKIGLIYLAGPSGIGKTWLMGAMMHRFVERGYQPYYMTGEEFDADLTAYVKVRSSAQGFAERRLAQDHFDYLCGVPILIVDNLSWKPSDDTSLVFVRLLDQRKLAKLATIIVSNMNQLYLSNAYGVAVRERLLSAHVCTMIGTSVRKLKSPNEYNKYPEEQ